MSIGTHPVVEAERARIREIDAIAPIINDPDLVWEAKYGKTACTAKELVERAALNAAVDRGVAAVKQSIK